MRAANELTLSAWDPVSKQPQFEVAAVLEWLSTRMKEAAPQALVVAD